MLATFPAQQFAGARSAYAAAYEAAIEARERLSRVERPGSRAAFQELIGKEVNVAALIKAFADQAGESIVCTRAFRDRFGAGMRRQGEFEAKDLREPPELFAPL